MNVITLTNTVLLVVTQVDEKKVHLNVTKDEQNEARQNDTRITENTARQTVTDIVESMTHQNITNVKESKVRQAITITPNVILLPQGMNVKDTGKNRPITKRMGKGERDFENNSITMLVTIVTKMSTTESTIRIITKDEVTTVSPHVTRVGKENTPLISMRNTREQRNV